MDSVKVGLYLDLSAVVRDFPVGCDGDLGNVQRAAVSFGESEDDCCSSLLDCFTNFFHFGGMYGQGICLVFFENGLASDEVVRPGGPGVTLDYSSAHCDIH